MFHCAPCSDRNTTCRTPAAWAAIRKGLRWRRTSLIDDNLLIAVSGCNGHWHITGPAASRRVGDVDLIFAILGQFGLKSNGFLAFVLIFVVDIAVTHERRDVVRRAPRADDFGLRVIDDNARQFFRIDG